MTRGRPLALLLAMAFVVGAAAAPAETPFALGVLRRDGILLPFAAFNGHEWRVTWPATDTDAALPISLSDVPQKWWGDPGAHASWTAWTLGEASLAPHPLALRKPELVRIFCSHRLGIETDDRGGPVDPREPTVAKQGVAIGAAAGAVMLESVNEVSLFSADARRIEATILDEFNKQETRAANHFTSWQHPYTERERKQYPIRLEALYRASDTTSRGGWMTSYVEAVRRFPPDPEDNGCGLITFVRGWVIEQPGRKPLIDIGARVTYCDREDVSFMLPFGKIVAGGESYWVYQMSSWRDEIYFVARVRPDGVRPVVAVPGGACAASRRP
jgi:hypothetical protein